MAVKRTGQMSFVEAFIGGKIGGSSSVLDRIAGLVKWYQFEKLLVGFNHGGAGHPAWPALVLFKGLLLQSLYGLSERELEEALADRLSFRRFAGLGLEETIPDHTVFNRFRNALIAQGLEKKLFDELDRQLEKAGVILKRGTMLDATLIEAVSRPGTAERVSRDPDARHGGKGGFTFGYKAHVGVDEGSGIIRSETTTPANVTDTVPADGLIGATRNVSGPTRLTTPRRAARGCRLPASKPVSPGGPTNTTPSCRHGSNATIGSSPATGRRWRPPSPPGRTAWVSPSFAMSAWPRHRLKSPLPPSPSTSGDGRLSRHRCVQKPPKAA
jgi:IS5 family transposase